MEIALTKNDIFFLIENTKESALNFCYRHNFCSVCSVYCRLKSYFNSDVYSEDDVPDLSTDDTSYEPKCKKSFKVIRKLEESISYKNVKKSE